MAKLDKINKEIDLLRSFLFLLLAVFVSIVVGLISRYDSGRVDFIFWIGVVLEPMILIVSIKVTKIITSKIKDLEKE
ncbi:MAG: hypothetical protein ACLFOC_09070 [Campylobacterales bacterium]